MALVVFESRVNMLTVATPSVGGYVIAYDSADGILKQKNDQGVITPIAGSSSPGTLMQTLAKGNNTGTYSINLGANTKIGSGMGGGQLRLDNGVGGANIVNLSTDYGALAQSYLFMSSNSTTLQSVNARLSLTSVSSNLQVNSSNLLSIRTNNAFITINGFRVLDFTTSTSPSGVGNRVSALISTSNSNLNAGVFNTVVLGGSGITGATSNSVYVPNLYVKDGGFVKGTAGTGQLTFNNKNEVFLTSNTNIIGILEANSAVMAVYNGIFITDNIDTITTNPITSNTFISTSNTTVDPNLTNVIAIGGDGLSVTQSNTTYIGGSVSIGNSYILPSEDGTSGQVIKTDGSGNTYWGPVVGSLIEITAASFSALGGTFESVTTYKILDADSTLYGGTEIYLTTNASGVLNETGVGKFYNPKYDQTLTGFGIFKEVSYLTGTSVFWGGKAWIRNSTAYLSFPNPAIDLFTLDTTYWDVVAYDDPFTQFYYNVAYDDIKYDWENDLIIYRNENNTNIVSSSVEDINYWVDFTGWSPIKVFQWGNVYDYSLNKGIGNNIITNSYNENINFRGARQLNLTFNNHSYQSDLTFDSGSYQNNLTFDNGSYQNNLVFGGDSYQSNLTFDTGSYQYDLTFVSSSQYNLTFDNASYQGILTFDNSIQDNLAFDNSSYQYDLTFDNSTQESLTFDNSYQSNLTFDNVSAQNNLTFNVSYQTNLTEINGYSQNNIRLDNYTWNRTGQTLNANEEGLTLTGSKLSYQTPFGQSNKGIGEVVFFGTASTTLDAGYIYQFTTTGEWIKADFTTEATAKGLLAIALGEYVSDGLLTKGYSTFDYSPYGAMTLGSTLYLWDNGVFNSTPSSTSGEIVRVIGYCIDEPVSTAGTLYFCPDTTWIEIA
jgi:hypothetical protein